MGGGDWHKLNVLYANDEYVEAQHKELRRFTGKLSKREYAAFAVVSGFVLFFVGNVLWRLLT